LNADGNLSGQDVPQARRHAPKLRVNAPKRRIHPIDFVREQGMLNQDISWLFDLSHLTIQGFTHRPDKLEVIR
jgi:hypothetical protein